MNDLGLRTSTEVGFLKVCVGTFEIVQTPINSKFFVTVDALLNTRKKSYYCVCMMLWAVDAVTTVRNAKKAKGQTPI